MKNSWEKEGINYWENEDCPREYLEKSLVELVEYVEGAVVPIEVIKMMPEDELREDVCFYEYAADK